MRKLLPIIIMVTLLGGCTSVPPLNFTPKDVLPTGTKIDRGVKDISISFGKEDELKGEIHVGFAGNVYEDSFKKTFEDALQESLIKSAIFNDLARKKILLVAKVLQFETPAFGIRFETDFIVEYQLLDTSTGKLLFTRNIQSKGEVPGDYAFMGLTRATEARNIAVRNNIILFLDSLAEFKE